jgi:IS5 family transposase
MKTKLHAGTHADGRPIRFFMSAGQVSDYIGAAALLGSLPKAERLLADRGDDADWFREALKHKGIKPSIPGRKSRGNPSRQATPKTSQPDRDHVRTPEGLAQSRNPP